MTTDPHEAWQVEPKPLPEGLDATAEPYEDPWNSVAERLRNASPEVLRALANWGTGDITWRHTEIGDE